ncbi:hypothetical protein [Streptomyces sp. B3I8]|uniref:hypothetical protein n=1 Tax=Streptomyces sp. B3I8 TaxID=3042303 RepID=UPI002785E0FE|nr:hypothetical protein [Streptomyces sp. B3I8]MDQ0790855.1 hypothetical protein [Streptomyces sp. B3I8]
MSENAYFANPSVLVAGTRQIELISQMANEMLNEFIADVSATSDWPGKDDSYAKQTIPKEREGREGAIATCTELVNALVAVGDGTLANTKNVLGTQRGVLDSIHDSGINKGNGNNDGAHSGKH